MRVTSIIADQSTAWSQCIGCNLEQLCRFNIIKVMENPVRQNYIVTAVAEAGMILDFATEEFASASKASLGVLDIFHIQVKAGVPNASRKKFKNVGRTTSDIENLVFRTWTNHLAYEVGKMSTVSYHFLEIPIGPRLA